MPPKGAGRKRGSAKKSTTPRSKQEPPVQVADQQQQQQDEEEEEQQQEVVVEESTFTQEITTEESTVEVKVVEQDAAVMDGNLSLEESKGVQLEGEKEEKNVEGDVAMDAAEEAKEGEEEEEEPEEEEGGQEPQEEEEEDGTQDAVEGEEIADAVAVGGGDASNAADNESGDSEGEENESDTDDEDDEEGVDLSAYMTENPLKDKKKVTDVEIFVGGLNRKAVEEDLIEVFKQFGEIKEVRIVKHPVTKRSKGYAFVTFATSEQAKKVLTELKDGIEVKGKRAGVSPSQDSDTLYMGNICKTWNKEQVVESLKGFGIEQIEEIYLPADPKAEGQIRGFAYLEFDTHSTAMAAFQRLRKPDAVFGRNRSAKVAFAPSMHPSEDALAEVKTIFVEGLTDSWDEEKLKQLCDQYGQVEKVQLSRDLATVKRKDFGFVTFTSRENALACVTAINNAEIGEGDVKVKANLAKPKYKGKLGKKAARGGYRVPKDGEKIKESGKSKASGDSKSKGDKGKGKATPKSKSSKGGKQPQDKTAERKGASAEKSQPPKGRKRDGRSMNSAPSGRPSKKPRGGSGRPVNGSGSRGRYAHPGNRRQGQTYARGPAGSYLREYPASGPSYQSPAYDMAPHAGYYRTAPSSRQDLYDQRPLRGGGYYNQGRRPTSYVGGSALPPQYPSGYSSYAPYESQSAGGYAYPSSGSYLNRRPYY